MCLRTTGSWCVPSQMDVEVLQTSRVRTQVRFDPGLKQGSPPVPLQSESGVGVLPRTFPQFCWMWVDSGENPPFDGVSANGAGRANPTNIAVTIVASKTIRPRAGMLDFAMAPGNRGATAENTYNSSVKDRL